MAILVNTFDLAHRFGARPLFQGVGFTLSDGERVGLIGPNGTGKSTLLQILAGQITPDAGTVARRTGLRVGYLPQTPTFPAGATVREVLHAALPAGHDGGAHGDWEREARLDERLRQIDLPPPLGPDSPMDRLSGGWQKRVALTAVLSGAPELLLLDEPTNHLDIDSILRLEKELAGAPFGLVLVTHDRLFLQRVANRILELDRRNPDGLLQVAGDYATYLERKEAVLAAQERREDVLRNTLRRETEWLRRGAPARSTKQQARIQRAETLAEDVAELTVRNRVGSLSVDFQGAARKPKRLIEGRGLGKRYGDGPPLFEGLDLFLGPGSRLGLIGPNGCGKSTLLRVLIGEETPSAGTRLAADGLEVAVFEQDRGSLDPDRSLADSVCPIGDHVDFRGARLHRNGYLERFLFRQDQMTVPVGRLSGGEQARLLVARLMLRPAHVLVLDEPTNDLDLDTVNVLEEALTTFDGAVLLVSHDRYFLDQVTTQILAFHTRPDEIGRVSSFVGLAQWEAWYPSQLPDRGPSSRARAAGGPNAGDGKRRKLGYREQREWEAMEGQITRAEAQLGALTAECARPEVVSDATRLVELTGQIQAAQAEVDRLYARWAELEAQMAG